MKANSISLQGRMDRNVTIHRHEQKAQRQTNNNLKRVEKIHMKAIWSSGSIHLPGEEQVFINSILDLETLYSALFSEKITH